MAIKSSREQSEIWKFQALQLNEERQEADCSLNQRWIEFKYRLHTHKTWKMNLTPWKSMKTLTWDKLFRSSRWRNSGNGGFSSMMSHWCWRFFNCCWSSMNFKWKNLCYEDNLKEDGIVEEQSLVNFNWKKNSRKT